MKVGPGGATTAEEESRKKINGTKKEKELKEEEKKAGYEYTSVDAGTDLSRSVERVILRTVKKAISTAGIGCSFSPASASIARDAS